MYLAVHNFAFDSLVPFLHDTQILFQDTLGTCACIGFFKSRDFAEKVCCGFAAQTNGIRHFVFIAAVAERAHGFPMFVDVNSAAEARWNIIEEPEL